MSVYNILLFHSVDDRDLLSLKDLGNMHPRLFERLILFLRKEFDIVSLKEMVDCISGNRIIDGRLLALTFDDGPKSYLLNAAPIMKSFGVPSACFLITDCIGDKEIYWRYLYNYCIHGGHERGLGDLIRREYGTSVVDEDIISFTRSNFRKERNKQIIDGILKDIVSEEEYRRKEKDLFMSLEDIEFLKKDPLVDFGVHTCSHPVMARLNEREIHDEIAGSQSFFKENIKNADPMFSVPFGRLYKDYDEKTVIAARNLGIKAVFSAYGGDNKRGQPLYNMRRISVNEGMLADGMASFRSTLKDLMTVPGYEEEEKKLNDKILLSR